MERFICSAKKFQESRNSFNSFKRSAFDLRDLRGYFIQPTQVTDGNPGAQEEAVACARSH